MMLLLITIKMFSLNSMLHGNLFFLLWRRLLPLCFNRCGHCKKLAPTWDELGSHFSKRKDQIVIAKMDSTANEIDVPGVAVRGFPTLYFFKGNDKSNPVRYEGARELDDLLEFLEQNAHHSFSRDEL
jgi:protein disulfide-isomerase-like protein